MTLTVLTCRNTNTVVLQIGSVLPCKPTRKQKTNRPAKPILKPAPRG
jgi:hypothetical protein